METQNSVVYTVTVRCHVVMLTRQPVVKTGVEGEEMDGDKHGENQQELVCTAVALGDWKRIPREGGPVGTALGALACLMSSSPGEASRSDGERPVRVAAKPGK